MPRMGLAYYFIEIAKSKQVLKECVCFILCLSAAILLHKNIIERGFTNHNNNFDEDNEYKYLQEILMNKQSYIIFI